MTNPADTRVGFIGLGNMGGPMAGNLIAAGYRLTILDLDRTRGEDLEAAGARWAATPLEVASVSDVVLTALPGPRDVDAVVLNDDGVFAGLEPDAVYIDTTTNDPETIRRIAEVGHHRGVHVLDAPISGGVPGAEAGTLTVFVGGTAEAFQRCSPLLQCIGETVVHMGPAGSGAATKLINNAMMFVNFIGACEGMAMGARAGLDLKVLQQTLATSMGQSAIFERVMDLFRRGKPMAHTTRMAIKDMRLSVALGERLDVPLELAPLVEEIFARFRDAGYGETDFTAVLHDWLRRAGVDLTALPGGATCRA